MKTKTLVIAIVLLVAIAVPATFATGIGISAGLDALGGQPGADVMLSLKLDNFPFLMGIGFAVGQDVLRFGFTADWWALNQNLFSFVNYYLGPGLYIGYASDLMLGGRLPIGLNIFPVKNLELFLEAAPTLSVGLGGRAVRFPVFGIQGAFGLRFWF